MTSTVPDEKPKTSRWSAWKIIAVIALIVLISGIVLVILYPDETTRWFTGDRRVDDRAAANAAAPARAQRAGAAAALPGAVSAAASAAAGVEAPDVSTPPSNARADGSASVPAAADRFISMDAETVLTSPPTATGDRLSRLLVANDLLIIGAPGKGRIYVFRAIASGWEQMRSQDRPNGFGSAFASYGPKLYVADVAAVHTFLLPDLIRSSDAAVQLQDGEQLMCATSAGPIIASSEVVRVGNREIYRSHNEIIRVRATRDGRLVVCTSVNTILMSADHIVEKIHPIPSIDAVEVRDGVLALARYDAEAVVLVDVGSGRELSRVTLPGGSDRPTGYGHTMAMVGDRTLAVSAPYDNVNTAVETGSVFVYRIDGNDMFVHDMFNTPEVVEHAHFGEHMVAMGNKLLVSSERIAGNAGRISVFNII